MAFKAVSHSPVGFCHSLTHTHTHTHTIPPPPFPPATQSHTHILNINKFKNLLTLVCAARDINVVWKYKDAKPEDLHEQHCEQSLVTCKTGVNTNQSTTDLEDDTVVDWRHDLSWSMWSTICQTLHVPAHTMQLPSHPKQPFFHKGGVDINTKYCTCKLWGFQLFARHLLSTEFNNSKQALTCYNIQSRY